MNAISDNLIHFLGKQCKHSPDQQFEIFKKIMKNGLRLNKTRISFGHDRTLTNYLVCFTDIPLSLCDEHTENYGKFGIGFKKSSIKKCGGSPVRYYFNYLPGLLNDGIPYDNRGAMYDNLRNHFAFVLIIKDELNKDPSFHICNNNGDVIFTDNDIRDWVERQLTILSFEKETGDVGPALDDTENINPYYKEREWRLVPLRGNLDHGYVIHDATSDAYYYMFNRKDVNMIVAPNDDIRDYVLKFMLELRNDPNVRLQGFGARPVPIITYDDLKKW